VAKRVLDDAGARTLKHVLSKTLNEEEATDEALTKLAVSIKEPIMGRGVPIPIIILLAYSHIDDQGPSESSRPFGSK
jgi:hypothetical protein